MATIFTKIVNGEIPCYKIAENEKCFAFLDINPLAKGHTLVIPKAEIDYILDIDDELLAELTVFAKKVAKAIEKAIPCKRIGFAVLGLEVPHTHIHLVPIHSESDIGFARPRLKFPADEMIKIAEEIRKKMNNEYNNV
jgi:histidine triad (HIT) family protein